MGIRFAGWGVGLGERVVTNDDLSATLETSDDWIQERTGIRERRIGGTASSLGITAAQAAMADAGVTAQDIDLVILSTTTGDRLIPGTAPTIAAALGITGGAMDLNAACSGFMYGVAVARGMIATGTQRVLLIGAENLSRWVDWDDRATAVLFGDGAGAVVIEPSEVDSVLSINLGADGSLADIIRCDHGGYIWMDGREVFRRAVRVVVESSERALREAGVTSDEIDILLAHQANLRILHAVADRLGLHHDKIVVCLDKYGNTSSASIPLAVDQARSQQLLSPGKVALMTGFGGGMTWASAVVRWS